MAFNSGSGASGFSSVSITVPAGSNRQGVFFVTYECTTAPSSISATLGGTALAFQNKTESSAGVEGCAAFLANEATLTTIGTGAKTFTASFTGGTGLQGIQTEWGFFTGRSQSAPVVSVNNGTSPPATASATAIGSNADIVASAGLNNAGTTTPGSGWTSIYNAVDGGGDAQACAIYQAGVAAGGYTPTVNNTGAPQWGMVALVLEASGGGGSTVGSRLALTGAGT